MAATGKNLTRYMFGRQLGKGTYGRVVESIDTRSGKVGAVKIINNTNKGISSLLELSILMTYRHPYLNGATRIVTQKGTTYIFQDKADGDLVAALRVDQPSFDRLNRWSFQIIHGLDALHQEGIIHCDMKPNNCLVFGDDIRITDYTLSVRKVLQDDIFSHSPGTCNYKAPEILLHRTWNEKVDVWSLGCTLYYLATGKLLIPKQICLIDPNIDTDQKKAAIYPKVISSIIDWRRRCGDVAAIKEPLPDTDFKPVKFSRSWTALPGWYRELILSMTSFDPNQRPSLESLVLRYFPTFTTHPLTFTTTPGKRLDSRTESVIRDVILKILKRIPYVNKSLAPTFISLSLNLYKRSMTLPNRRDDEHLCHIEACVWIACKLLIGESPDTQVYSQLHTLLIMEQRICAHLSYRLHISEMSDDLMVYYSQLSKMDWISLILICLGIIVIVGLFVLAMTKTRNVSYERHRVTCSCGHTHYHEMEDMDD